jgi:hypothetical protein
VALQNDQKGENIMKRFTILFAAIVSFLALSTVFEVWADARAEDRKASAPVQVYDSTGAMLEAINARSVEESPVAVYDSTGAMLEAINPARDETFSPVYDATGAMLEAINPQAANANAAGPIVYDATGAMLEAIQP